VQFGTVTSYYLGIKNDSIINILKYYPSTDTIKHLHPTTVDHHQAIISSTSQARTILTIILDLSSFNTMAKGRCCNKGKKNDVTPVSKKPTKPKLTESADKQAPQDQVKCLE